MGEIRLMKTRIDMSFLRLPAGLAATLIVFGALLLMYNSRIAELENRKNALLLAGQLVSEWDLMEYPGTGIFDSTAVVGGVRFDIRRTVSEIGPGIREMRLYIGEDGEWTVELSRVFSSIRQN